MFKPIIFALTVALVLTITPAFVTAAEKITYSVSPNRDEVYNGNSVSPDYPYWTQNINGQPAIGYLVYKDIRRTSQVVSPKITSFLKSGTYTPKVSSSAFDARGRWLGGIYDDGTGTLRGFYHAEAAKGIPCDPISGIKSIAYAESTDGGQTWRIPNYPNNQIITGQYADGGAGDFRLRVFDGYLYIFYYEQACGANALSQGTAVARAPIATKGRPGSWTKYHCDNQGCAFKSPGIGGKFTRPSFNGRNINMGNLAVSWNDYLGKYFGLGSIGGNDILMLVSDDLVNWTHISPVYTLPAFPDRGTFSAYRNVLSLSGDMNRTGQSFWFYYIGVNRGKNQHILYRQQITLTKTGSPSPTPVKSPTPQVKIGDANGDGQVNNTDLVIWKSNYGKSASVWPTGARQGNFNSDTLVDGLDYAIWFRQFAK